MHANRVVPADIVVSFLSQHSASRSIDLGKLVIKSLIFVMVQNPFFCLLQLISSAQNAGSLAHPLLLTMQAMLPKDNVPWGWASTPGRTLHSACLHNYPITLITALCE